MRQCGKTTLARALGGHDFDLEQEPERLRLDKAADMIRASRRYLLSKTKRTTGNLARASCNLPWLLDQLQE